MRTAAQKEDRNRDIRRIFGLKNRLGMDDDTLRDVALQVTGVCNPKTGAGSISKLDKRGRWKLIKHLEEGGGAAPVRQKVKWLASDAQIKFIEDLHTRLAKVGRLEKPLGFMESQMGVNQVELLPKSGKRSAGKYIEMLKDICTRKGINIYD